MHDAHANKIGVNRYHVLVICIHASMVVVRKSKLTLHKSTVYDESITEQLECFNEFSINRYTFRQG